MKNDNLIMINVGCGMTPVASFVNMDNSFSIRLSKFPFLAKLLYYLKFFSRSQLDFILFAHENEIRFCDASKCLPFEDESVDFIYSSHMLEHLDIHQRDTFLIECLRVLKPDGAIRLVVPDMEQIILEYTDGIIDMDNLLVKSHLVAPPLNNLISKIKLCMFGHRHHQWMYDGRSLANCLAEYGFVKSKIVCAGSSSLENKFTDRLDLYERSDCSIYIEAMKG